MQQVRNNQYRYERQVFVMESLRLQINEESNLKEGYFWQDLVKCEFDSFASLQGQVSEFTGINIKC